ncbi:TonB-dependent receptor [Kordiimonas aestuarii]|uniref:TonB-dependent receptor n=1 Tax=Kordiimonas aestuarii TaxID=1005925 RepID=UPI0021CDF017|nr:TonB-dependent receptor [Kordiimonas aestuarii]
MSHTMKQCLLAGTCIGAVMSVPAAAQSTTDTDTAQLEEIVVTARQREESLKDVPIAVSAITGDKLKEQQIYAVKDIAAYVPGLNINSDSVGRAFVSIRGVGTTLIDTVQPGVGIFIDGIYQPNTSYLNSPLVDVERVEVLRGPQGTLFGNNTLGGAINVITRKPGDEFEGRVDGAYADSDDFRSLSASVSGPIVEDVLQLRLGAAYHHHDGFQENVLAGGYSNPLTQKTVNGTIRLLPSEWAEFTLNASYDKVKGGNVAYLGVAGPTDYSLEGASNVLNIAEHEYKGVNLKGEFDVESIDTIITTVLAYNRRDQQSVGDGDYGPVDFFRSAGESRLVTKTGELRFDTNWSARFSTLLGVFTSRSTTDASGVTTVVPAGLDVPSASFAEIESQAVFGTAFIDLSDSVDLAVGLRYDHQKLDATNAGSTDAYEANDVQPRVTLTKNWNEDVMTYASVARGVRGGGQNGPGAPNLIYRGDSVWTYELGTKLTTADKSFSLDAAVFYNDYKHFIGQNALAPSTTGAGYVAVNLNSGTVHSYGAEAEMHWQLTSNWRIDASATLLHARIVDGSEFEDTTGYALPSDRIIFTPDWNFSLGTNYVVPVGDNELAFDLGLVGKGSRMGSSLDPDVAPLLETYYLVNGSITWRMERFEVAAFVSNLFNDKYMESYIDQSLLVRAGLAAVAQNLGLQGERRRIGVRATVRF